MKEFLFGLLFAFLFLPIIQNFTDLLQAWVSLLISKINQKIYKIKEQMGLLEQEEEKMPIGFCAPMIEEQPIQYQEEQEDDDNEFKQKKTKTNKKKIAVALGKKYFTRRN